MVTKIFLRSLGSSRLIGLTFRSMISCSILPHSKKASFVVAVVQKRPKLRFFSQGIVALVSGLIWLTACLTVGLKVSILAECKWVHFRRLASTSIASSHVPDICGSSWIQIGDCCPPTCTLNGQGFTAMLKSMIASLWILAAMTTFKIPCQRWGILRLYTGSGYSNKNICGILWMGKYLLSKSRWKIPWQSIVTTFARKKRRLPCTCLVEKSDGRQKKEPINWNTQKMVIKLSEPCQLWMKPLSQKCFGMCERLSAVVSERLFHRGEHLRGFERG